ncbi:MAG: DNA methyltransferase [Planctomycetota bacterium]
MPGLFPQDSPLAERQPKTDTLILSRLLDRAAASHQLQAEAEAAHPILIKWADLETSGKLDSTHETQLQGPFCEQVFGDALGYPNLTQVNADQPHLLRQEEHIPNAGTADAALGEFLPNAPVTPAIRAVLELKGPAIHLDRSRSNGRTPIAQCWDYLYALSGDCRWGIVSNFRCFRLYDRTATPSRYEHFSLQSLRDPKQFRRFFAVFHVTGLVKNTLGQKPRVLELIQSTNHRQREVGDQLYDHYSKQRTRLIEHLIADHKATIDNAIDMAQRLLDRVIFIAFCEDRKLLPDKSIKKAYEGVQSFAAVTNPRWQNFKNLFRFIDLGSDAVNPNLPADQRIPHFNGGLFAPHAVDDLELPDEPWTTFFNTIGSYSFADEVNLDVLGHLFERSITELEKLKNTGVFTGDLEKARQYAEMPQSAKRKRLGVYYTPAVLTERVVRDTLDELIAQRFAQIAERHDDPQGATPACWQDCLDCLRALKVIDPACGSGAFLFQAYRTLETRYHEVLDRLHTLGDPSAEGARNDIAHFILNDNLYGVDLSPEAVEITQLALWIQSADRTQTLASLGHNIVHGNSLVSDPEVHPDAIDFPQKFPEVFERDGWQAAGGGFDVVLGNPPWERIKLQEREFFSIPAPEIATASNAAKRRKLVARLESDDPALYERYEQALASAQALMDFCRKAKREGKKIFPLTGKGDINTYAVFAELAFNLVAPHGRVGLLVPSGIASDKTTKDFFAELAEHNRLIRLYDFENKKVFFPEVHASFKFCFLNFGGSAVQVDESDFVFFAHSIDELEDPKRHVRLTGDDIELLNPNTKTCPIFRSRRDAQITKGIYRRVPVLIDHRRKKTGNPWGIRFKTMFHQTNDAELFREAGTLKAEGFELDGNRWVKGNETYLPLYEAKMFRPYDHRHGTVYEDTSNWINQGQTHETNLVQHQNPEHLVVPRWWVDGKEASGRYDGNQVPIAALGFRDVTRATDTRTFLATMLPSCAATNKVPLLNAPFSLRKQLCLLGCLNSFPLDYCTRQKFGGISLNFFIVEQIPTLTPDRYDEPCPWDAGKTLEDWISERVLKLTCTAEDMLPLAEACGFSAGSFKEYDGKLHKWNERERAELMAELDAGYFHLYGLDRNDAEYILSTFKGVHASTPLLGGRSVAENILDTYDHLAALAMGGCG